jgi:hypothetical protein
MYRDESCPIVLQMDGVLRGSVRTPVEKSIARREVLAGGSDVSWKDGGIRILSPDVRFGTTDSPAANRCPCPGALRLEYERHRRKKRSVWKQAFLGQAASRPPRAFSPAAPRLTQARRHAAGAARAACCLHLRHAAGAARAACCLHLRHAAGAARAACCLHPRHAAGKARAACHAGRPASTSIRADRPPLRSGRTQSAARKAAGRAEARQAQRGQGWPAER